MSLIVFLQTFWNDLSHTFIEFLYAPLIFREMLWILLPVLAAIVLMDLYFMRYPRESIGHHKSLESSIFLVFISFDLIRFFITNHNLESLKTYIIGAYLVFVIAMVIMDFMHRLPISLIFRLPSKYVLAFISYIVIILIYSDMLDSTGIIHLISIFVSIILLFLTIAFVRKVVSVLEPKSYEELEHFLSNIEKDIKKTSDEMNKPDKEESKKTEKKEIKKNIKKTQPK